MAQRTPQSIYWCAVLLIRLMQRILFLESIAGVPGMVAATVRHLQSLRLMVRISYHSRRIDEVFVDVLIEA